MYGFEVGVGVTLKFNVGRSLNTAGIKNNVLFTWFYFLS